MIHKDIAIKWETSCPNDGSTVMQTFTPIGGTSAEISLTELTDTNVHTKNYSGLIVGRNAYTSVAFVDKKVL